MRHRINVNTESGLVIFRDAAVEAPSGRGDAARTSLRAGEEDGPWFYLDADDTVEYQLELTVDEDPPDLPEYRFQRLGGTFLLRLPTGRLAVSGIDEWADAETLELDVGQYSLSVRGPGEFDGQAHDQEMRSLVGREDWERYLRIDRLGLGGCLSTVIAAAIVVAPMTRAYWPVAIAALALGWLPHLLLARTTKYRRVASSVKEFEASLPHYAIQLDRIENSGPLQGGHLHVR
jgi:hypothetical protein